MRATTLFRQCLCIALPLFVTACADAPQAVSVCPPVKAYTPAQEAQVAREIAAMPDSAETPQWITDYLSERAELRACRAAVK